jgi:hypothetical protein
MDIPLLLKAIGLIAGIVSILRFGAETVRFTIQQMHIRSDVLAWLLFISLLVNVLAALVALLR